MAIPPPPPNIHSYRGDDKGLVRAIIEWVWAYYRATVLEGYFASNAELLAQGEATIALIDPVDATAASAQETANDALTLATVNDGRLDINEPVISDNVDRLDTAEPLITAAQGAADDAQDDADTNTGSINTLDGRLDTAEPAIIAAQSAADDARTVATGALSVASDTQGSIKTINATLADIQVGTITVSDTATTGTATVSFADTAYNVVYGALSSSGTPAAGAFTPVGTGKTTTQITITVQTAPGSGNSVTFDFIAKRPQ